MRCAHSTAPRHVPAPRTQLPPKAHFYSMLANWAVLTPTGALVDRQLLGSCWAGWRTYGLSFATSVLLSSAVVALLEARARRHFAAQRPSAKAGAQSPAAAAAAAAAAANKPAPHGAPAARAAAAAALLQAPAPPRPPAASSLLGPLADEPSPAAGGPLGQQAPAAPGSPEAPPGRQLLDRAEPPPGGLLDLQAVLAGAQDRGAPQYRRAAATAHGRAAVSCRLLSMKVCLAWLAPLTSA
jgi:hypothetical protein